MGLFVEEGYDLSTQIALWSSLWNCEKIWIFYIYNRACLIVWIENREDDALAVHISVFEGKGCPSDEAWLFGRRRLFCQVEMISHEEHFS